MMSNKKKTYDIKLRELRRQATAVQIEEADNKSKTIWKVINRERKTAKDTDKTIELEINGQETNDPQKVAHHLNEFFTNIANETLQKNPQCHYQSTENREAQDQISQMSLRPSNEQELSQHLTTYACRLQLERGIERHNRNTRQAMNFTLPVHHLSLFEEKPSYMGVKFLNLLPETIKGPNRDHSTQLKNSSIGDLQPCSSDNLSLHKKSGVSVTNGDRLAAPLNPSNALAYLQRRRCHLRSCSGGRLFVIVVHAWCCRLRSNNLRLLA
ncbi:hypothetical protein J6590_060577 [Homalodisca vitripennis]|nr:hypothetical protein J6590_060577 [Homalodisca vitripennis]